MVARRSAPCPLDRSIVFPQIHTSLLAARDHRRPTPGFTRRAPDALFPSCKRLSCRYHNATAAHHGAMEHTMMLEGQTATLLREGRTCAMHMPAESFAAEVGGAAARSPSTLLRGLMVVLQGRHQLGWRCWPCKTMSMCDRNMVHVVMSDQRPT